MPGLSIVVFETPPHAAHAGTIVFAAALPEDEVASFVTQFNAATLLAFCQFLGTVGVEVWKCGSVEVWQCGSGSGV
jgi:hypothetical protein